MAARQLRDGILIKLRQDQLRSAPMLGGSQHSCEKGGRSVEPCQREQEREREEDKEEERGYRSGLEIKLNRQAGVVQLGQGGVLS